MTEIVILLLLLQSFSYSNSNISIRVIQLQCDSNIDTSIHRKLANVDQAIWHNYRNIIDIHQTPFLSVVSCRIFEHFVILPDPDTEFIKLRSTLHKQGAILVPKQADPLSRLKKQIHPFHLDRVFSQTQIQQPCSGSMQCLYYINRLVRLK